MTIIGAHITPKGLFVAGDSLISHGDGGFTLTDTKVLRKKNAIWGFSGDWAVWCWLRDRLPRITNTSHPQAVLKKLYKDALALPFYGRDLTFEILLSTATSISQLGNDGSMFTTDKFLFIGCGGDVARGYYAATHDLTASVLCAIENNTNCGGPVRTEHLQLPSST